MQIYVVREPISENELREIAKEYYVSMIKGVVDVKRSVISMGGEYHVDANNILLIDGSSQEDVWGFNWYFDRTEDSRIEYISLINIRPLQDNPGMEVEDQALRLRMKEIITALITP